MIAEWERPLTDEELAERLRQSPWEQGSKKKESQTRMRALVVCEWCLMFAALPGKPRCGSCEGSKGESK